MAFPFAHSAFLYGLLRIVVLLAKNISFVALIMCTSSVHAESGLFTWKDADGNTHFANEKTNDAAVRAELPSLEKRNLKKRIAELQEITQRTCVQRGGTDCSAGADVDGSVICMDGHKDSEEVFSNLCKEVKLQSEIVYIPPKDISVVTPDRRIFYPVVVRIRNLSATPAHNVQVQLAVPLELLPNSKVKGDTKKVFSLEGPGDIAPFGVEEYTYTGKSFTKKTLGSSHVRTSCEDCWDPLAGTEPPQIVQ